MATARFMETWAHGLDVADALGVRRQVTDRIRHVVHLGVRTRDFAFATHGADAPGSEFRVELTSPSGEPVDIRSGDRRPAGQWVRSRLRPAGHPAPAPCRRRPGGRRTGGRPLARLRAGLRWLARPRAAARMSDVLRIGNCSGFYGDRLSAMREMLLGGELDVLTGDYLAELTMLILGRDAAKDPSLGYARSFVRQLEDCLGLALERGVKIVSNAGGLNPAGLVKRLGQVAAGLGLAPAIARVEGDDLRSLGFPGALTANAYLGGFGIAAALSAGADIVVTGRVTDASLVVGPGVAHFGWTYASLDGLRRRGRGRPRAGVRRAGHGRKLLRVPDPGPRGAVGLPAGRARCGRVIGCRQARRHRWRGHGRHGHGAAGLRDPVHAVPRPRRHHPARLDRLSQSGPDRSRHRCPRHAAPGPAQGVRQRARRLPQQRRVRADRPRRGGQGGLGTPPAHPVARRLPAGVGDLGSTSAPRPDADAEEAAPCLFRCTVEDPSASVVG